MGCSASFDLPEFSITKKQRPSNDFNVEACVVKYKYAYMFRFGNYEAASIEKLAKLTGIRASDIVVSDKVIISDEDFPY